MAVTAVVGVVTAVEVVAVIAVEVVAAVVEVVTAAEVVAVVTAAEVVAVVTDGRDYMAQNSSHRQGRHYLISRRGKHVSANNHAVIYMYLR